MKPSKVKRPPGKKAQREGNTQVLRLTQELKQTKETSTQRVLQQQISQHEQDLQAQQEEQKRREAEEKERTAQLRTLQQEQQLVTVDLRRLRQARPSARSQQMETKEKEEKGKEEKEKEEEEQLPTLQKFAANLKTNLAIIPQNLSAEEIKKRNAARLEIANAAINYLKEQNLIQQRDLKKIEDLSKNAHKFHEEETPLTSGALRLSLELVKMVRKEVQRVIEELKKPAVVVQS